MDAVVVQTTDGSQKYSHVQIDHGRTDINYTTELEPQARQFDEFEREWRPGTMMMTAAAAVVAQLTSCIGTKGVSPYLCTLVGYLFLHLEKADV